MPVRNADGFAMAKETVSDPIKNKWIPGMEETDAEETDTGEQIQDKQIQGKQRAEYADTETDKIREIFTQTLKRNNIGGDPIPMAPPCLAERELAESFGPNLFPTVRGRHPATLVEEAIVKKVQGKGTFVMRHARDNAYTHFRA